MVKDSINNKDKLIIKLKSNFEDHWRPVLKKEDLDVDVDYEIFKIEYKPPIADGLKTVAKVHYYSKIDILKIYIQKIPIVFKKSKNDFFAKYANSSSFGLSSKILNTFIPLKISYNDIIVSHKDIQILEVVNQKTLIEHKKINLKILFSLYGTERWIVLSFPLQKDYRKEILKVINLDSNSNVEIKSNFSISVTNYKFTISNIDDFDNDPDLKSNLLSLFKKIKITYSKPIEIKYVSEIKDNKIKMGFDYYATLDGQVSNALYYETNFDKEVILTNLKEYIDSLVFRKNVVGAPRKDITFWDIFEYKKTTRNINMLIANYVKILVVEDIKNDQKKYNIEFIFSKELNPRNKVVFLKKEVVFGQSLKEIFKKNFSVDNIRAKSKLDYVNFDLKPDDFQIGFGNAKIKEVELISGKNFLSNNLIWKFIIEEDGVKFEVEKQFYFFKNYAQYLFDNMSLENINFDGFKYLNLVELVKLKQKNINNTFEWIDIPTEEFEKLSFKGSYANHDFIIRKVALSINDLRMFKLPKIKILVYSSSLNQSKNIDGDLDIKFEDYDEEFANLTDLDIRIKDNDILRVYPMPILETNDFVVKFPFVISEVNVRYFENEGFVSCLFVVEYNGKQRQIKKELYFEFSNKETESIEAIKNEDITKLLNNNEIKFNKEDVKKIFSDKNIEIIYDPDNPKYYIDPNVRIKFKNYLDSLYYNLHDWKLLGRKGKVKLQILVRIDKYSKIISKVIRYNKPLTAEQYSSWKENYK